MGLLRSKARVIFELLISITITVAGASPLAYRYLIYDTPAGPKEVATTTDVFIGACILIALIAATLEGLVGTVQAIRQLSGSRLPSLR